MKKPIIRRLTALFMTVFLMAGYFLSCGIRGYAGTDDVLIEEWSTDSDDAADPEYQPEEIPSVSVQEDPGEEPIMIQDIPDESDRPSFPDDSELDPGIIPESDLLDESVFIESETDTNTGFAFSYGEDVLEEDRESLLPEEEDDQAVFDGQDLFLTDNLSEESAETEEETEPEGAAESKSDPESEEDSSLLEEATAVNETVTGTVTYDDPTIAPDGRGTVSGGMRQKLYGTKAAELTNFTSFGDQLSSSARRIYNNRVSFYIQNRKTTSFQVTYTQDNTVLSFPVDVEEQEINGEPVAVIDTGSASYKSGVESLLKIMQASADAFYYDYPELFWYRPGSYNYEIDAYKMADGTWMGYVKRIISSPSLAYPGASGQLNAFDAGVETAVAQIELSADYNLDGFVSTLEYIQGAHDYLCERMWYDSTTLSAVTAAQNNGQAVTDYHIFSAAGAFIDSTQLGTGVVCEGYAKAFAVLLKQAGIPCSLVAGTTSQSTIGHMWNAVKYEGVWYLVDPTWDDNGGRQDISYSYYMTHSFSGYRTPSGYISGSSGTTASGFYLEKQDFAYPAVTSHRHSFSRQNIQEEECTGFEERKCSYDPVMYWKWFAYPNGHLERTETLTGSTCITHGTAQIYCARCGRFLSEEELPLGGHSFNSVGKCSYCGKYQLSKASFSLPSQTYTGSALTPAITLKQDGRTLTAGTDYSTGTYSSNINCGTASVTFTGKGQYIGQKKVTFTIARAPVSRLSVSVGAVTYTGAKLTPAVTVKDGTRVLKKGTDYQIVYPDTVNAGTTSLTLKGIGNYTGTRSVQYTIKRRSLSDAVCTVKNAVYSGQPRKPAVTVKRGEKVLSAGKDYTLTWSNNTRIGTASVQIKGIKNYTGSRTLTFSILPSKMITVKVAGKTRQLLVTWLSRKGASGYELQYSASAAMKNPTLVKLNSTATRYTVTGLVKGKTYYVRMRIYYTVNGKKYYSAWSNILSAKVL